MERKYRDREHQENLTIIVPVIICPVARARGTQYTKRLLPEFLIPHSVIRLDYLLEAVDLQGAKRTEAAVCDLLGCLDPRTARHQMRRLPSGDRRSFTGSYPAASSKARPGCDLPEITPDTSAEERFLILF